MEEFLFVLDDLLTTRELNLDIAHQWNTSIKLDRNIIVYSL